MMFRSDRLFNSLFHLTTTEVSKPKLLALCEGNPPVTAGFPSQRASKGKPSMMWRHHDKYIYKRPHIIIIIVAVVVVIIIIIIHNQPTPHCRHYHHHHLHHHHHHHHRRRRHRHRQDRYRHHNHHHHHQQQQPEHHENPRPITINHLIGVQCTTTYHFHRTSHTGWRSLPLRPLAVSQVHSAGVEQWIADWLEQPQDSHQLLQRQVGRIQHPLPELLTYS